MKTQIPIYQDTAFSEDIPSISFTLYAVVIKDGKTFNWSVSGETYFSSTKETADNVYIKGKSTDKTGAILACREAFHKHLRRM